jgi:predicted metal-dependent phosphoesterase TrpH
MKSGEMLKADLHVHTDHSKDSRTSPRAAVRRALELGFDVIAVTDHNTVSGSLEAERAAKGSSLIVIPGQEVSCHEGEVIILGLRETLPNKAPCLDIMEQARKSGGFVIVPHPFDLMRKGLGRSLLPSLDFIDAVEVFNSRTIFGVFNSKALSFAQDHGLPMTVGSDTHFPEEMGHSYMLIDAARDVPSILKAISYGRTKLVMKGQPMPQRIRRGMLKIRTYF